MKSLYTPEAEQEILGRINSLTPQSQKQWGKMQIGQMLAHCSAAMETAIGEKKLPRMFIGKILGPLVKSAALGDKPFTKGSPTDKNFIITDERDFNKERTRLTGLVKQFTEGGTAKCTTHPHSFFGKLTPDEWGMLMYKHIDHHLRQFSA